MITRLTITAALALFCIPGIPVRAQEHPREHPGAQQQSQFQQVPDTATRSSQGEFQTRAVTKADISVGIKRQIASDTKKSGDKKFHIKYAGKDLALDLIKVHDDRLSNLGGGKYFACVDMKATNGKFMTLIFHGRRARPYEGHPNFRSQSKQQAAL